MANRHNPDKPLTRTKQIGFTIAPCHKLMFEKFCERQCTNLSALIRHLLINEVRKVDPKLHDGLRNPRPHDCRHNPELAVAYGLDAPEPTQSQYVSQNPPAPADPPPDHSDVEAFYANLEYPDESGEQSDLDIRTNNDG